MSRVQQADNTTDNRVQQADNRHQSRSALPRNPAVCPMQSGVTMHSSDCHVSSSPDLLFHCCPSEKEKPLRLQAILNQRYIATHWNHNF